jgi:FAD/FMN-containing dehydrogenase
VIDLTHLNATEYNPETKVASIGTGARWGEVYSELQEHQVGVTGGRQSPVGVGGLTLGGGVGWTTPRTGFACDNVVNYEVVLASGEIVNANASCHSDLWRALKGGSSNFGIVTKFDIETFPTSNITLERRTIGPEHTDEYIDAIVDFTNLDQSYDESAMVSVISYTPDAGIMMTATEVNTVNNASTTAFDKFNRMPVITTTGKNSYTLPDAAAIGAPELAKSRDAQ